MFTDYLDRLQRFSPLSQESKVQLTEHLSTKRLKKGELLLKQGAVCKHLYYIRKGIVRIFYYKNGRDITEWIASEAQFFFSIKSYFEQSPSRLMIEALEDSSIILLSREGTDALTKQNIEVANLLLQLFSGSLKLSQERMDSLQFETARTRYLNLLDQQPEILRKVPLHYVASFLGISQETLSRIRSKG